jgi:hypothetical protein
MNYNRLKKDELIEIVKTKDAEINKLVDHIISLEQSSADRINTIKSEAGLFAKDFVALIRYVFEQGVRLRKAVDSLKKPLLTS